MDTKQETQRQNIQKQDIQKPEAQRQETQLQESQRQDVQRQDIQRQDVQRQDIQQTKVPIKKKQNLPITSVQLSSYKGIIIALCVAILFWTFLQWTSKNEVKKTEIPQSPLDKTREFIQNKIFGFNKDAKSSYQQTAESVKNKLSETVGKMSENKEQLKDKVTEDVNYWKNKVDEVKENVVEKTKDSIDASKQKSQKTMEESKQMADKTKEKLSETKVNVEPKIDMLGLIEQSQLILHEFLSPRFKIEEQIPTAAFSGAKAIIFLSIMKGGVGVSGVFGTGIMLARNEIGKWSGPCAIQLMGADVGLNIGVEKSDHIILLHDDDAIRAFTSKHQLKLGLDVSIAAGPKGRDASVGFSVGSKGYATTMSYSIAKGAYLGVSFEGHLISIFDDCNEQFYGKKVDSNKILDGSVKPPKDNSLAELCRTIDQYTAQNLVYPEHTTDL